MNTTISNDQQDEVSFKFVSIRTEIHKDVYHRTEESWASHLNTLQVFPVGINYAFDSFDFRLLEITIHWETMADLILAHVMRNSTKPEEREEFEVIVALEDVCNL